MVTIGLPVYNGERWIRMAIESVLAQTYDDWELIVVDDGSTDKSVEQITNYKLQITSGKIRVIADGEHKGIAARLNQMVRMARGEYFARMDADDVMMPERLEKQLKFMEEHPEADVVGCRVVNMDERGEEIKTKCEDGDINGYRQTWRLTHPTLLGRTAWFWEHPYNEEYSGCEDWELWLRVRGQATLLEMNEPLLYYRRRTRYDVRRCWRERWMGIRVIWKERQLFGSTARAVAQMGYNLLVMGVVPMVHLLHLDRWVILGRIENS